MFNNDVTQTYHFQDASKEIIIMLFGAFLLGCLLCWLIKKFLTEKEYSTENSAYRYQTQTDDDIKPLRQAETTSDVRIVKNPSPKKTTISPKIDDLTKIGGIDSTIQQELKKQGITAYTDLRDIKTQQLKEIQNNLGSKKREVETWPHQANLAAKGDWKKLSEYQSFIERAQLASQKAISSQPDNADDLKVIKGIGPRIEEILNKKEIHTFKQLSNIDSLTLKKHIVEAEQRFENNETESWPHQAAMAEKGQWDELKIYQEFMESEPETPAKTSLKDTIQAEKSTKKKLTPQEEANTEEEEIESDHDDLKKIEGIGPKIEEVLNKGGIYTYSQLYNSDRDRLRKLLDDAGNQFKMHDPESWPHQAGMADRKDWDNLKSYQEIMDGSSESKQKTPDNTASSKTETKADLESTTSNIHSKKDDFKRLEGIGPKIELLLNESGIETFEALSKKSRDDLKEILDVAGPQYRMHEPKSWPHQAELAADGEWEKLEEYKSFLLRGRE